MKLRSRVAAAFGLVVVVTVALLASGRRSAAASSQGKCDFGPCRGLLRAGTYSSREFFPTLTYTVPAGGWANYTDWAGNFSLAPPGVSRAKERNGVDAIEVIAVVQAPEANCSGNADLKVPQTVNGIVHWLVRQGGLVASVPRRVAIGGLKGYSLTLRLARRGGIHCGGGSRSFPVIWVAREAARHPSLVLPACQTA